MRIHSISTICRKCLMLLALLLASIQLVHAQEESGTTTTENKVYGEGDLIATDYAGGSGTRMIHILSVMTWSWRSWHMM